jgi:peptidoglycan/LPS O-acetylase OafA/YrhL
MKGTADFSRNNLDCLRLILASIVALYHIDALTYLPAFSAFGKYLSPHFAVKSFFVISGMLIYQSYTRSSSLRSYMEKRVRRIYPAYFTVVVLAAVGLCFLSTLPLSQYFFGIGFWKYLVANLLFLNFLAPSLPGVFTTNVMPAVNGALWTLKIEVIFYLFVPVIFSLSRRYGVVRIVGALFILSCVWKYGFALLDTMYSSHGIFSLDSSRGFYAQLEAQFPGQLLYFCAGILLLVYFDKLKQHFLSIAAISACLFLLDYWFARGTLDVFWMSGVVFVFGFWRYFGDFSKFGDFSYGVYIVHFPIVQTLAALGLATMNPAIFLAVTVFLIGIAGIFMWHLVEKRFLKTSSHYRQVSERATA